MHSARRAHAVSQVVVLDGHLHVAVGDLVGYFRLPPFECAMLAFSCCMRSQPTGLPNCMQQVLFSVTRLETVGSSQDPPRILRPARCEVGRREVRYVCGFLSKCYTYRDSDAEKTVLFPRERRRPVDVCAVSAACRGAAGERGATLYHFLLQVACKGGGGFGWRRKKAAPQVSQVPEALGFLCALRE